MYNNFVELDEWNHCFASSWLYDSNYDIEIEIGSSTGEFLCAMAAKDTYRRFIGVDILPEKCASASKLARTMRLDNICFVSGEGKTFISQYVDNNTISALHIYFPSPPEEHLWGKLISKEFVSEVRRVLITGGEIRIVTDQGDYFSESCEYLKSQEFWFTQWPDLPIDVPRGYLVGTQFERRYREEGKRIYYCYILK